MVVGAGECIAMAGACKPAFPIQVNPGQDCPTAAPTPLYYIVVFLFEHYININHIFNDYYSPTPQPTPEPTPAPTVCLIIIIIIILFLN